MDNLDPYQERYLKHQERKKRIIAGEEQEEVRTMPFSNKYAMEIFAEISQSRTSHRIYSGEEITREELGIIKIMSDTCPSSCARKAVDIQIIDDKEDIRELEGLLVGGANWSGKADKMVLLWADMQAYKSPNEIDFMPYLDAGVKIQQIYITCTALGIKCCYINPNIREENKEVFKNKFGDKRFCGAFALGR